MNKPLLQLKGVHTHMADRIIVLHNGQLVADGEPAAVIVLPVVQQAYLGVVSEVVV